MDNKHYLLMNFLSGAADLVDNDVIELLTRIKKGIKCSKFYINFKNILEYLYKRGYILNNQKEETEILQKLLKSFMLGLSKSPMTFAIIPTYYCNLRCIYCYESNIPRTYTLISLKKIRQIFNSIKTLSSSRPGINHNITLFGGEPLLADRKEKDIICYIFKNVNILNSNYSINYNIHIFTNGTEINYYLDLFESYYSLINQLQITLDGPREIHNLRRPPDSFNKIVNNIDIMLDMKIPLILRINVDMGNIRYLPQLASFFEEKGWMSKANFRPYIGFVTHLFRNIDTKYCKTNYSISELFLEILKLKKSDQLLRKIPIRITVIDFLENIILRKKPVSPRPFFCGATTQSIYIFDPYGDVYNCFCAVGNKDLAIGKYIPKLLFNNEKLKKWTKSIYEQDECKNCMFALICGGGCIYDKITNIKNRLCKSDIKNILKYLVDFYYEYLEIGDSSVCY